MVHSQSATLGQVTRYPAKLTSEVECISTFETEGREDMGKR